MSLMKNAHGRDFDDGRLRRVAGEPSITDPVNS
jgi:hypothetical protein